MSEALRYVVLSGLRKLLNDEIDPHAGRATGVAFARRSQRLGGV